MERMRTRNEKNHHFFRLRDFINRRSFFTGCRIYNNSISYEAAPVSTRQDDPDAPYLPERYRQQVKAKKQRRIYKKLVIAGMVIVVSVVAALLLINVIPVPFLSNTPTSPVTPVPTLHQQPPAPVMNVTVAVTPAYVMGTGISALNSPDVLSLNKAISLLLEEYPAETYTLISANLTDRYSGLMLYEFTLQPVDRSSTGTPFTVLNNGVTGEPYTPGQENARITSKQAQDLVKKAFPALKPDQVMVRYSASTDSGRMWSFVVVKGPSRALTGSLDAESGLISSFTQTIPSLGRPAEPVLDMPAAQKIAARYLTDHNGPVAVNMTTGQYFPLGIPSDPVAGQYVFTFNRIVKDIPCNVDGFIVGVDSVTGEITAYNRHWSAPDNAFSVASDPLVLKREATFAVLQRAKEMFPESVNGLHVISTEIRWKDQSSSGVTPRPGSIPLAWKVTFDDDIIRANSSAKPAIAWVDAQTGSIMDFQYKH